MQQSALKKYTDQLLDHLFHRTDIGIAVMNHDGRLTASNSALQRLTGLQGDQLPGASAEDFLAPRSREAFRLAVERSSSGEPVEAKVELMATNGLFVPCSVNIWPSKTDLLVLFEEDEGVTSFPDVTTGAETAERFYEQLSLELYRAHRYGRPLAIVKCQLDNADEIFQQFDESIGTRAIAMVGWRLRKHTRRSDLVARVSSTQFAILLPETNLAGALSTAEKLGSAVREIEIETRSGTAVPTASFGVVATSATTTADPQTLVDAVDWALSVARERGPGGIEAAPGVAYRIAG